VVPRLASESARVLQVDVCSDPLGVDADSFVHDVGAYRPTGSDEGPGERWLWVLVGSFFLSLSLPLSFFTRSLRLLTYIVYQCCSLSYPSVHIVQCITYMLSYIFNQFLTYIHTCILRLFMYFHTYSTAEWRRRTRVAYPSPEGSTAWRRERYLQYLLTYLHKLYSA